MPRLTGSAEMSVLYLPEPVHKEIGKMVCLAFFFSVLSIDAENKGSRASPGYIISDCGGTA